MFLTQYYIGIFRLLWYAGYYLFPFPLARRLLLLMYVDKVGMSVSYQPEMRVFSEVKVLRRGRIEIGNHTVLQNVLINAVGDIYIGDNVFFGHGVMLLSGSHDVQSFGIARQKSVIGKPIVIEDGVWVASGSMILGGVTIGQHAVVAAGSVVTKDVPPYAIVAGCPAHIIRYAGDGDIKHGK